MHDMPRTFRVVNLELLLIPLLLCLEIEGMFMDAFDEHISLRRTRLKLFFHL